MGNRAIITSINSLSKTGNLINPNGVAIYLHWNGGRDSVRAFLRYCELRGFRAPDDDYGWARLVQVISNYFGVDGLSIGVGSINDYYRTSTDNGFYLINGWKIAGRYQAPAKEQTSHKLKDMLMQIDEAQPETDRLGPVFLNAKEKSISNIKIGDYVFLQNDNGIYESFRVIGFGTDHNIGGSRVFGVPYVDRFHYAADGSEVDYEFCINNYLSYYGKSNKFYVTDKKVYHHFVEKAKEEKKVDEDFPEMGEWQYAVTLSYMDGNNSTYLFKDINNAREFTEETIQDIMKEVTTPEDGEKIVIQSNIVVNATKTVYGLNTRTPTDKEYKTVVTASISNIYR